jgi:hypothetical protein
MLKAANTCARNDRTQDIKDAIQKLAKVASRAAGVPATATFKWTPNSIGYVDLKFPDESAAKDFNYYTAIYAMRDAREAWPSWSWGIEGFTPPQRIGNILRIGLGHFGT